MKKRIAHLSILSTAVALTSLALASDHPAEERQDLMDSVRKAAKPLGGMMQGKLEYNAATAMKSLKVWADAGEKLGGLFPEGSQGGDAAPAIWEDRAGFEEAIAVWSEATAAAIEAAPSTLEEARPVIGPAFNSCKNCHDSYRIDED